MKRIYLLAALVLAITGTNFANNILVTNASISGQNTTTHTSKINFDVAWDNSWRTSTNENNYDAAWIFVKYRKNGTNDWRHATISATGNTPATGASFNIPTDGKGAFIYRSANGIGSVNYTANQLQWNYSVDGLLDNETVEISVFALEMVYVPSGSYVLGSGGTETNTFKDGVSTTPYRVATAGSISTGTTTGTLNFNGSGTGTTIPATFPTGFNAFWIMKYECSQQQFADFLNHLDVARANALNFTGTMTGTHPNLVPNSPDRAVTTVGFQTNAALADWSGLRPYSELEYEKACRGFNTPALPNEYAWGNTTLVQLVSVDNPSMQDETVATPANANATLASFGSTSRVGLFARPTASTRELSGATYYGIMNMSDNAAEITIFSGSTTGRAIDASVHGDGYLATNANTDVATWLPSTAFGTRGGAYNSGIVSGRVSHRAGADFYTPYPNDYMVAGQGIRLARTAQ